MSAPQTGMRTSMQGRLSNDREWFATTPVRISAQTTPTMRGQFMGNSLRLPPGAEIVSGTVDDYVWGTLVLDYFISAPIQAGGGIIGNSGANAPGQLPIVQGDIIQFRDVTTITHQNGGTQTSTASHHTAIIEAVLGGGSYRVLEQNWDGGKPDGRVVRETTINLASMTQGHYWIYQPVAK